VRARAAAREEAPLAPAVTLDTSKPQPKALWSGIRVYLADQARSPAQAFELLSAGKGYPLLHADDDFGRQATPAWATFALENPTDRTEALMLSTRQTTLEVFELYRLTQGQWERVLGRHELAKDSFERDRTPSFELSLSGKSRVQYLLRTETAAPIKYLLEIQSEHAYRANGFRQHFWVIVAYAVPLALMLFIALLRRMEHAGGDPLFIGLVVADLLASSWLIGLAPEIFPTVSGWTFRWFGQLSYGALFFLLCWHERVFLALNRYVPWADKVLRSAGWIGLLSIVALLVVDLRLGAQMTLPILLSGSVLCLIVSLFAYRHGAPYAKTYSLAIAVYVVSGLAYVLYYLGVAPMEWFGVLAFCQTAGICIIMSFAVAGSLLAKDQKLQDALSESDQQRREIQVLAMERDRIFAAANHDLRQPLQAVALNLELMRQFDLSPEQQAISARMRLALASMSNMLSSFLDLRRANISEGALKLEPLALGPMLERLGLEYREHARAKGLSLKTVKTSAWVLSDALLLERAIRNLLSNALRYTDQGRVLIGVRRRGVKVSVVVIDSGRGISNEQLRQLFQEGKELEDPSTTDPENGQAKDLRYESYGLGLFIVKAICDRLRATVLVDSKVGEGSAFQILLPSEPAGTIGQRITADTLSSAGMPLVPSSSDSMMGAHKSSSPSSAPLKALSILVVDDDDTVLSTLNSLLAAWGAKVTAESNAQRAQALLTSAANYDVVICDFDLGTGKTGLDLLRIAQLAQPDAKRILVSGGSKEEILATTLDQALLWFSKPVEVAQLLQALVQIGPLGYSK
jgi:signal transduction histidine kinase/CheY-like chemotaxis protein